MRHPYLPFFPEKFFADTAHVPGDVAGYYVVLLAHAWARGGSLPDDDDQLRLMTRCHHKRWPQIRAMLRAFWFIGDDGRLHQKRLDREWKRAETWHQNQGKQSSPSGGKRTLMRVSLPRHKGIKPNENNAGPPKATRARASTHTHTQNSLSYDRENSEGAAALSVRAHASPRQTENQPLSSDPATDERIAAGLASLAYELRNNSERERAQEKLNAIVKMH